MPPPKPNRTLKPGDFVDSRYELVRPIGSGGMGVVWVANSLMLGVPVAIKVIHPNLRGTVASDRMAREARAAAQLGHEAIARVIDFGRTSDGMAYMAMELLNGESLRAMLDRSGRMSASLAAQTLLPIADGLAAAHDKGIVHRDLKPDNIFLARDGVGRVQPKLLDFGIAKYELDDVERRLTQEGTLIGSPDYMSPEQACGQDDVDLHSDIWQFCVVLYECITGTIPFTGTNYNALLRSIIHDPPTPTMQLGAGDENLWRVIERGLHKETLQRWSSMWEVGEALALWLYEQGVREDICANSLRTRWLESGLSGVQVVVESGRPPRSEQDTLPPGPPSTRAVTEAAPAGPETAPGATGRARTGAAPQRGARLGIGLSGLLVLTALGWFAFSPPGASTAGPPPNAASGTAAAPAPERVRDRLAPPAPGSSALPASAEVAASPLPSSTGPVYVPRAPARSTSKAGGVASHRAGGPPAPKAPPPSKERDFGF